MDKERYYKFIDGPYKGLVATVVYDYSDKSIMALRFWTGQQIELNYTYIRENAKELTE